MQMTNPMVKKIHLLSKIPAYNVFYRTGIPALLPANITLSLLYSCNSRCNTCNVYKKRVRNFSLEEYKKLFESLKNAPYWFTLSGGEPFLRKDIAEIAKVAYDICKPGIINIPTNGSLNKVIYDRVHEMVEYCKSTEIIINLSLDQVGEKHDKIRGYPGNWERALLTYEQLKKLTTYPNFTLGIHTVISNLNVGEFQEIYKELIQLEPDSYITEIAEERVELGTIDESITPGYEEYSNVINFLLEEMNKNKQKGIAAVTQAFRIEYYQFVKDWLKKQDQMIPCKAGVISAQVSPDGEIWPCCIRADSMGNLREENYDFLKIWKSSEAYKIRKSIKFKECHCPLANAGYTNILSSPKFMTKVIKNLI